MNTRTYTSLVTDLVKRLEGNEAAFPKENIYDLLVYGTFEAELLLEDALTRVFNGPHSFDVAQLEQLRREVECFMLVGGGDLRRHQFLQYLTPLTDRLVRRYADFAMAVATAY
jgi:hypothetical protein